MKRRLLAVAALLAPGDALARATCLGDEEIEKALGDRIRSGALVIDTRDVPNIPLCSGLTLAQQMQRIRAKAFPEEQRRAAEVNADLTRHDDRILPVAPALPVAEPVAAPQEPPEAEDEPVSSHPHHAVQRTPRSQRSKRSTVVYGSCRAARAAGAAPIRAGEPGYSRRLDRDGDGIACE